MNLLAGATENKLETLGLGLIKELEDLKVLYVKYRTGTDQTVKFKTLQIETNEVRNNVNSFTDDFVAYMKNLSRNLRKAKQNRLSIRDTIKKRTAESKKLQEVFNKKLLTFENKLKKEHKRLDKVFDNQRAKKLNDELAKAKEKLATAKKEESAQDEIEKYRQEVKSLRDIKKELKKIREDKNKTTRNPTRVLRFF
jgi:DNA repair exonuclease SbcCD ATPase subunit